jgi:DNA-binding SARP family transcriptional activator
MTSTTFKRIEFLVLGPFEVWADACPVRLNGRKQRALLAVLALRARQIVSKDILIAELWGETPPRTARNALHNYVSLVRRAIGSGILQTRDQSYLLAIEPDQVDLLRFEQLVREGHAANSIHERAMKLREAVALCRGPALSDLAYEPFVLREAPRLEELQLKARQALIEAELELGHAADLVPDLEALVAAYPFREHFHAQLMLALYRSGRQVEALAVYRRARTALLDQLGVEPGPELRRLEQAILRQSQELDAPVQSDRRASAHRGRRGRQKRLAELVRESVRVVRPPTQGGVAALVRATVRRISTVGSPPTSLGSLRRS